MWGRMNKFECKESQNFVKKGHLINKIHNLINYFRIKFFEHALENVGAHEEICTQAKILWKNTAL